MTVTMEIPQELLWIFASTNILVVFVREVFQGLYEMSYVFLKAVGEELDLGMRTGSGDMLEEVKAMC